MVCLGQNGHFRRKMLKYAAVWQGPALPHQIRALRPPASQYAAARQHSGAYPATFAPLRMHSLNRTFAWCASVKVAISREAGLQGCWIQNQWPEPIRKVKIRCQIPPAAKSLRHTMQMSDFNVQGPCVLPVVVKSDICMVCLGQNRRS